MSNSIRATTSAAPRSLAGNSVLVVGGAGYVGSILTGALLSTGCRVRVLDNLLYDNIHSLEALIEHPEFSLIVGDFGDVATANEALEGMTDVILLASLVGDPISKKYPKLARRINMDSSAAFFDLLYSVPIERFVFTSTCSNYGLRDDDLPVDENAELRPLSIYAEAKVGFEEYIHSHVTASPFSSTILRISTAFGMSPRMRFDLTVNEFANTLARGETLVVYDKDTWRPYCHIRDIARAIISVLQAPDQDVRNEIFNVGSDDNNFTKKMLVDEMLKYIDGDVTYVDGGVDPRNYRVSFKKIQNQLGFDAAFPVGDYIPVLLGAIKQGMFADALQFPERYGNITISNAASYM